jgi:hypothetical protein
MIGDNPFFYGRPVPPSVFVGREDALTTLFSRVRNTESIAVVGQPHIGKSSLLHYAASEPVRRERLGSNVDASEFVEFDCHLISEEQGPEDFWSRVLERIEECFQGVPLDRRLQKARQTNFSSFSLADLFRTAADLDWRVILLVDEFDCLISHPRFTGFFSSLRSFATNTGGLALVTASRMAVTEMNRRTERASGAGSPFFNNFTECRLRPLQESEVDELINAAVNRAGTTFTAEDRAFIRQEAGRHPYLVQVSGAAVFEASRAMLSGAERYAMAQRIISERAAAFLDDLWNYHSGRAQAALTILCLANTHPENGATELQGVRVEQVDSFGLELRRLIDHGLIEPAAELRGASSEEPPWRIAAASLTRWIWEDVLAEESVAFDFHRWLYDLQHQGVLTQTEHECLANLSTTRRRFRVAFSFPGEIRDLVQKVAGKVAAKIGTERVFYDKYYEAELAKPDLDPPLTKHLFG